MALNFARDRAGAAVIVEHLADCDGQFVPQLSSRVDLAAYGIKLAAHATRFEAWDEGRLVGLVAAYLNDPERWSAFISNVSVAPDRHGEGIASRLLVQCIDHARAAGFARLALSVDARNDRARALYSKHGFVDGKADGPDVDMILELKDRT